MKTIKATMFTIINHYTFKVIEYSKLWGIPVRVTGRSIWSEVVFGNGGHICLQVIRAYNDPTTVKGYTLIVTSPESEGHKDIVREHYELLPLKHYNKGEE
tara:strand:- start:209 stop:508 length:300 start_codon:yes stop_codon:yes gene_type:complete